VRGLKTTTAAFRVVKALATASARPPKSSLSRASAAHVCSISAWRTPAAIECQSAKLIVPNDARVPSQMAKGSLPVWRRARRIGDHDCSFSASIAALANHVRSSMRIRAAMASSASALRRAMYRSLAVVTTPPTNTPTRPKMAASTASGCQSGRAL